MRCDSPTRYLASVMPCCTTPLPSTRQRNHHQRNSDSQANEHTADAIPAQIQPGQPGQVAHWIERACDGPTPHQHQTTSKRISPHAIRHTPSSPRPLKQHTDGQTCTQTYIRSYSRADPQRLTPSNCEEVPVCLSSQPMQARHSPANTRHQRHLTVKQNMIAWPSSINDRNVSAILDRQSRIRMRVENQN
jgi:hypothetical protein